MSASSPDRATHALPWPARAANPTGARLGDLGLALGDLERTGEPAPARPRAPRGCCRLCRETHASAHRARAPAERHDAAAPVARPRAEGATAPLLGAQTTAARAR